MKIVLAVAIGFLLASCSKPDPSPWPPPVPLKGQFELKGRTVTIQGAVKESAKYSVDTAKYMLTPALELLEDSSRVTEGDE